MVYIQVPLDHHLFQTPEAESKPETLADAHNDHLRLKCRPLHSANRFLFISRKPISPLPPRLQQCPVACHHAKTQKTPPSWTLLALLNPSTRPAAIDIRAALPTWIYRADIRAVARTVASLIERQAVSAAEQR